ncbi:MAG: hypothetical protein ACOC7V_15630 [Spirochaetota bacterium]
MSLPVLFSLIFATLLGLLPIFLLVGRRAIASRLSRRRDAVRDDSPSDATALAPDDAREWQDRPAPDSATSGRPKTRLAVSGTGEPAGESAILDRLIRERRAAAGPKRESARDRIAAVHHESTRPRVASDRSMERGSRIEGRLARLSVLQRAVVYREILGPPIGLRAPGERESS